MVAITLVIAIARVRALGMALLVIYLIKIPFIQL